MTYKKNIFATLMPVLFFSYAALCQSDAEKISLVVKHGEQIWNATSPDKSYLSEGSTMEYGLGYLNAGNYSSASWSFKELLRKNKDNAFANYFMGCVHMGLNDYTEAQKFFDHAVQMNEQLKTSVPDLARAQNKLPDTIPVPPPQNRIPVAIGNSKDSTNKTGPVPANPQQGINRYKAGDNVEVTYAGGWWPGVVTKVEGEGKTVYVSVDFLFQNAKRSSGYFYNGVRPVTGQTTTFTAPPKAGGPLVYGDYVLTLGLGNTPAKKGFFKLNSNGTYVYNGVKGKYSYHPETGNITWKSGTFFNWGKNTSSFTRGTKVVQIDMTYTTKSGPLYYSGGRNLY
jgi:hypothetical protein